MKVGTLSLSLALALAVCPSAYPQQVNGAQQVSLLGLRASANHGSFPAAAYAADGSLYLLLDEGDGVRVVKSSTAGDSVIAQSHAGASGDSAVALALDPSGNVYVTGTTTSGSLDATSAAAFPTAVSGSTNSFLAKYDANLNLMFLTFLGAGQTTAAGVAATADGVFVSGTTLSTAFPVTAAAVQRSPAYRSTENGFVERFRTDGSALVYATYLSGANGNTFPSAIVADSADDAYVAGATSSSGYPTVVALQSSMLPANASGSSGFLTRLNAAGSAFAFSTFIAGNGISGLALDAATNSLLLSGDVSSGQFPVASVPMPLASASYQTMLRISEDGQSVGSSVMLVPGTRSYVASDGNGGAWVSGSLTTPLFPGVEPPDYTSGDSFLLHLTSADIVDQTLRFGGLPVNGDSDASLTSTVYTPAASHAGGASVALPGMIATTTTGSLTATPRFDLPTVGTPNALLPSSLADVRPAAACGSSQQCTGTGALLAVVNTAVSTPSLSVSTDDLPNVIVRNLGSAAVTGVEISVSDFTYATNCTDTLAPSNQCTIALTGSGPGSLTVSSTNAAAATTNLSANTFAADALALSAGELDFGIVTSVDSALQRTITVSNLSSSSQTFSSAQDGSAVSTYTFAEVSSDCVSGDATGMHVLAAKGSCHIVLGLTVSGTGTDAPVRAFWKIGNRDLVLTGFAEIAALNVSATELDFGTVVAGVSVRLPRYLYLSNNSDTALEHDAAVLPGDSPFSVADGCPSTLEPHSICQLVVNYVAGSVPSDDAATLALDGLNVLLTGATLPAASAGSTVNPSLIVSPNSLNFSTPVLLTGVSPSAETLTMTNTGGTPFALALEVTGDFMLSSACPPVLTAGASCLVQVVFAPSQPGEREGLLSVTAGSGFTPTYVPLSGTGTAILPANNGTLDLGQTLVGEPLVAWYKVQQPLTSLTARTGITSFGVALVEDTGYGHGSLPPSSFAETATASCNNCWLGVQFLTQSVGTQTASLTLASSAGGSVYPLTVTATAAPVQGLLLTPISQDFGPVAIHSSSGATTFSLANLLANAAAVTVQSVTVSGDFTLVANSSGGASCSGTLAWSTSCFVQVVFAPTATGDRNGTLSIATSGGTVTSTLTGFGDSDPGLAINPTALDFESVPGISATQQTVTLSNTGASSLLIAAPSASDPSFSVSSTCSTLQAGARCTMVVTFSPQSAPVMGTLSIPVTSIVNGQTSTTPYTVALTGGYTTQDSGLQIIAGQANYGPMATGGLGASREFTLNNLTSEALAVTFSLPRQFPLASPSPCGTLAAGGSCSFSVAFLPVTGGPLTGTVFAHGTPANGAAAVEGLAYMLGYGAASGSLTISGFPIPNSPVSFGQVISGQKATLALTLTNSGTGNLTIHRVTSEPPFFSTSNCGATLTAGAACTVTLTYAPINEVLPGATATPRADAGTLIVESDAASSPDALPLTGSVLPVVSSTPASSAVLNAFQLSNSSLTFANTQVGNASATQMVTMTNTGTTTIHLLSTVLSTDFTSATTCTALLPDTTCNFSVRFTPTTVSSATIRSGTMEILTDAATSLEFISLIGTSTPAPLTLTPTSLDFGTVNVGDSDALSVTMTNNAPTPITFQGIAVGGDYSVATGACPASGATLAAGASCTLTVTFKPSATGTRTGTLSVETDATQLPLTVSLTGTGIAAQLTVTPGALAFGSIDVGAPASLKLTLLNIGSANLTGITDSVSGVNATDFAVTAPCSTTTLAPNQGCTETVTFTPSATGARAATLTLGSSDPKGPVIVSLTGTGANAGSFVLMVNGTNAASATVASGSPATYGLTLTPTNGFTGAVALTCSPVTAGQYASCSLLASTLTLGSTALSSTATINTVTSLTAATRTTRMRWTIACLLLLSPLAVLRRKRLLQSVGLLLIVVTFSASGCGGGPSTKQNPNLEYTPAGTYQYQVTASSTSGTPVSSTVTLTLVVQ